VVVREELSRKIFEHSHERCETVSLVHIWDCAFRLIVTIVSAAFKEIIKPYPCAHRPILTPMNRTWLLNYLKFASY
jgi:hypothetical protein